MPASNRRVTYIAAAIVSVVFSTTAVAQDHNFANWTSNTTFTLNGANATVAVSNIVDANSSLLSNTGPQDGNTNYPDTWYTPTPPVGILWSVGSINNATAGNTGSADITVTFDTPVTNPRFHFQNLDNATADFTGLSPTLLSGNLEFEVSGSVLNAIPNAAQNAGCEDDAGGNPNGACGTVEFSGEFTTITWTLTDTNTDLGAGDGHSWTVSAAAGPVIPPAQTVPTLSTWSTITTALLLLALGVLTYRRRVH